MGFALVVRGGATPGRRFEFDDRDVAIGRAPENDLLLIGAGVSRSHARIRADGARYLLVDERSANGTALNGLAITRPEPLRRGDRIGIGPIVLEFRPRRRRTVGTTALASLVLAATAASFGGSAPSEATSLVAPPAAAESSAAQAAVDAPGDGPVSAEARAWYDRGRRRLGERHIAPRNLYDAWVSFTTANRLLGGRTVAPPLDELAALAQAAERDLASLCKKLLFAAGRFERYGQEQKAEAVYREVLLHFPGDDPSGCRAQARRSLADAEPGDGSAG